MKRLAKCLVIMFFGFILFIGAVISIDNKRVEKYKAAQASESAELLREEKENRLVLPGTPEGRALYQEHLKDMSSIGFNEDFSTSLDRYYSYRDDLSTDVEARVDVEGRTAAMYLYVQDRVPHKILDAMKADGVEIHPVNGAEFNKAQLEYGGEIVPDTAGFFGYDLNDENLTPVIYIDTENCEYIMCEAVIHEIGHYVDYKTGFKASINPYFYAIQKTEYDKNLTCYFDYYKEPREYFAEMFAYLYAPANNEAHRIGEGSETYHYIENVVDELF